MTGEKDKNLDRENYLKEIRQDLLKKLGLPPNTKPNQVETLLKIKEALKKIEDQKKH